MNISNLFLRHSFDENHYVLFFIGSQEIINPLMNFIEIDRE